MRRWRWLAGRSVVGFPLVVALLLPGAVRAAAPAPTEPCVPGTIWEDLLSGVKYLCIYDELAGGPRWDPLESGQASSEGYTSTSTTAGCVWNAVTYSAVGGGGGGELVRSVAYPCRIPTDRLYQPPGEIRLRTILQRYTGSIWATCRDSGYQYNTVRSWTLAGGVDMGTAADCGVGYYRTWGFGQVYQGGSWLGSPIYSPFLWQR